MSPSAYTDGTGTFHPDVMRTERGAALAGTRTIRADACVIGSGAGGAVVAKELAEGGMDVVVLEEGEWWDTGDFDARPGRMTQRLYRDAGQSVTLGTPPIALPLGARRRRDDARQPGHLLPDPSRVLDRWRAEHGLEELTDEHLEPFARRVEELLNVVGVPPEVAGANAAGGRSRPGGAWGRGPSRGRRQRRALLAGGQPADHDHDPGHAAGGPSPRRAAARLAA